MFTNWGAHKSGSSSGHSRTEHISSFLNDPTLKPSTRKVSKDDTTYDTIFQTQDANTLLIRVHIPPLNKNSKQCPKPSLTLLGVECTHPWLDEHMMVVGYGPISSDTEFLRSRLLLSQIVSAIIQHFQMNSPSNVRIIDKSLQKMQPSRKGAGSASVTQSQQSNNGNNRPSSSTSYAVPPKKKVSELQFSEIVVLEPADKQQVQAMMDNYALPTLPNSIPQVASASKNEMTDMLNDNSKLLPKLEQNQVVIQREQLKNILLSANHLTATTNLNKKDQLHNLHEEVVNSQYSLKAKVERYNELRSRQLELCKPVSNDVVLKKLKKAKKSSMKESDDLANAWLDRSTIDTNNEAGSVDTFIDEFLKKRTVHHVRAAKMERIKNS